MSSSSEISSKTNEKYDVSSYHQNWRNAAAGALGGFASRLVSHPLDVLKIRLQLQIEQFGNTNAKTSKYSSFWLAIKKILREEGPTAFYKGHLNAQILAISSLSLYFLIYEKSMHYFERIQFFKWNQYFTGNKVPEKYNTIDNNSDLSYKTQNSISILSFHSVLRSSLSGLSAGLLTMLITYPLDTTRTRFSAQTNFFYRSIPGALRHIVHTEGPSGLYRGMMPALINNAPSSALFFGIYKFLDNIHHFPSKLHESSQNNYSSYFPIALIHFVNSSIAAGMSKALTYPLDIIQKRLQVQGFAALHLDNVPHGRYCGMLDCFNKMMHHEGVSGLFKGYKVAILRQILMYATSMTVYEYFKSS